MPHPADSAVALETRDRLFAELGDRRAQLDALQRKVSLAAHAGGPSRFTPDELAELAFCVSLVLGELALRADGAMP